MAAVTSYETALCVVPPLAYCPGLDKLRELYDKAYGRWPPHINVIYPFVAREHLPRVKQLLETRIVEGRYRVRLDSAGYFPHRQGFTIFASEDASSTDGSLKRLRDLSLEALDQPQTPHTFHLSIGQSADDSLSARDFLLSKAKLLPRMEFDIEQLVILVRENLTDKEHAANHMKLWDTIDLPGISSPTPWPTPNFWIRSRPPTMSEDEEQRIVGEDESEQELESFLYVPGRPETTYAFDDSSGSWKPSASLPPLQPAETPPKTLDVATYNVLMDSHYPPSNDRDASLLDAILSESALADVLLLQEISDGFLEYLLGDKDVRTRYPYCSHGPPEQADIGPLPSLRNLVVLSRLPFAWTWLPFQRRHKGAIIASFTGTNDGYSTSESQPLVLAGIHLTSGLTDGAVAAKKIQMSNLLNFLKREHPMPPWIIAGDFNITTSSATINLALKNRSISARTIDVLSTIEVGLLEAGFLDCWSIARLEAADDSVKTMLADPNNIFEGEEGATFNPQENALAAETSGTSNNRPQRYDRILVRGLNLLRPTRFNMFGFPRGPDQGHTGSPKLQTSPSDHFGIRTSFKLLDASESLNEGSSGADVLPPIEIKGLGPDLSSSTALNATLSHHHMFPSETDITERQEAFSLIKTIISGSSPPEGSYSSQVLLEITPVGSYALGVWTADSDVDCLCIGNISHKTFFKLARQRIRRAAGQGVRILRKVEANSGTMLELSVNGIQIDLQYCAATRVVEEWSSISNLPHNDPSFDLPILSLRKLKPYRDLDYIKRTMPDFATFRLSFRCIKLWAITNGLYSSKFGYLGGIHITLMLSTLCKRMANQVNGLTAEELVSTFFHHYSKFDWAQSMVYDPFFFKTRPRYHRTSREPMVILGFHAPNSNVAHTSTPSGLDVLISELQRADHQLSDPSMTWMDFFGPHNDDQAVQPLPRHFLQSFDDYVRIDVQYWGRSLSKGKTLVGWLESRCLNLIIDIPKVMPDLTVRVWPARFCSTDAQTGQDYHGCYLIGLARKSASDNGKGKADRQAAKDALITVLKRFENQLCSEEKYYDAASSWICVDLVKRSEVGSLHLDQREWGDPSVWDADEDTESEDEEEEEEGGRVNLIRPIVAQESAVSGPTGESKKLRPASDVLNRLRWDPNLHLGDYIIGYEDRFLGAKETTLEKWKSDKTDEEFIPQHRILYFRRKNDGVVVWERKSRIDRVFGSGIGGVELPEAW